MRSKVLLSFISCTLLASTFVGCSNSDDVLNNGDGQEVVTSKVAPLNITVGKNAKSSRVIIDDNNGKGGDSNDAVFAIDSLKWESSDYLWVYSPDYVDPETNKKGGYTQLKLNSAPGGQTAQFTAVGESKYVPGKPLYIYYHGGNQGSPNGIPSGATVTEGVGDGTVATFTRPYDKDADTKSSALFSYGKDAKKSVQDDPFFMRSAYIASAPGDGVIPDCTLQGRMSMLSFRIPWGHGLVSTLTTVLGTLKYDITIACKDKSGKWVFPDKVSLKHDSEGNLTETVDSYGEPLQFTIDEAGLTNITGSVLYQSNGMVYVSIPAVSYQDLRVQVKVGALSTNQGLLKFLLPALNVDNQVLVCPKTDKVLNLDLNPNNTGKYPADYIYGLGNIFALGSHQLTWNDLANNPALALVGGISSIVGQTIGIYSMPGANWQTYDGSLLEIK